MDELIGDFLRTLDADGFLDDTIVVYTSDHGELAGEHGLWWKHTWHEASVRVPLFVQTPAQRNGTADPHEVTTPVSLADLFPTLCGLTGIQQPDGLDGMDLTQAVRTGSKPNRGPVFSDNFVPRWGDGPEFRVVRDGQYKYVHFRSLPDLLFDIESDLDERNNLLANASDDVEEVAARLRSIATDSVDFDRFDEKRAADEQRKSENELVIPKGTNGNVYLLPDGRLVDGETMLYKPDVLTATPEEAFADWPDDE
jgi:choline-sulfatase